LEKRTLQRLDIPLEVTVEVISAQATPLALPQLQLKSRNISKGGICLETKSIEVGGVNLLSGRPFARENLLRLIIELNPDEPPLVATGEVRWYDIVHDMPEFICRLGVAFIEIEAGGKDQLARFMEKHQNNKGYFRKLLGAG
jgi:hypothetical protein